MATFYLPIFGLVDFVFAWPLIFLGIILFLERISYKNKKVEKAIIIKLPKYIEKTTFFVLGFILFSVVYFPWVFIIISSIINNEFILFCKSRIGLITAIINGVFYFISCYYLLSHLWLFKSRQNENEISANKN